MAKRKEKGHPVFTNEDLMSEGWMSTDKFLEKFNTGLKYQLEENFCGINHPEDYMNTVLSYVESLVLHINTFGVGRQD